MSAGTAAVLPHRPRRDTSPLLSSAGVVGWRVRDPFAAVLVNHMESAIRLQLGHHRGVSLVQEPVVFSAEQDEVVEPCLAVLADPLDVVAFAPGGWAVAAREPAVPVADDQGRPQGGGNAAGGGRDLHDGGSPTLAVHQHAVEDAIAQ